MNTIITNIATTKANSFTFSKWNDMIVSCADSKTHQRLEDYDMIM